MDATFKRFAFPAAMAAALGALAGGDAVAQSGDAAAQSADVIVVTGSRIARRDADGVGPMLTLTREDIQFSAPTSAGDLLQSLPSVGVSLNSNGTQGTAFGASSINLRYLGSAEGSGNRTLVLVDGHRWVNATGGRGFRDFVDLNTIPLALIDHIEVLKDGASAIYGADAIAGVVNIHTKSRLEGVETDWRVGQSSRGDNQNVNGFVNWGRRLDGVTLFLSASYNDSQPIDTAARELTRTALAPLTAAPTSPRGLYVLPGLSNNAYFGTPAGFAQNAANAITRNTGAGAVGPGAAADDSFHVARLPDDYFNTQVQGIYATGPSRRGALFGRAAWQLGEQLALKAEALYTTRSSSQLFAPFSLDLRGSNGYGLAKDQLYNPFGSANVPAAQALGFSGASLRIQRVPVEVGNRDNQQQVDTARLLLGLDGRLDWLAEWRWDATFSYASNRATFDAFNQVNLEKVYRALGPSAQCATGCVPLDIFGPITPAMADYIRYNAHDFNSSSQADLSLNATSSPLELAGGPLGLAIGYEYRKESARDDPDAFAASLSTVLPLVAGTPQAPTSAQSRDPTRGSYDLHEAYFELNAPLLAGQHGAPAVQVDAALRYSRYSTVGGKPTAKLGLQLRPSASVLLRGTWAQGFRAPSILELYQGQRQTDFPAVDPCNGGGASLPGCAGVPASYNQSQFHSGLIRGLVSGNRNLKPDSSDSLSVGLSIAPPTLPGFTLTADKFQITIRDAIAAQSATQILQACANSGNFCELLHRAVSGEVLQLTQAVVNLARIEVSGIDATLRYRRKAGTGKIDGALDLAWLQSYRSSVPQPDGSVLLDERAGKSDQPRATFPRLKAQASLRYLAPDFSLGWKARYIGASADIPNNAVNGGSVAAIVYQDAQLGWTVPGGKFTLAIGVDNLFDKQPPASAANNPINFDIYSYDIRGRYMYARLSSKF
ncbi:MAG: TonB-dependent receptor [Pseudomonadota bacterium]